MSICPKNKSSKGRRDKRRANWKMTAPTLVKCSKCGELMVPHRVCRTAVPTIRKRSSLRTKMKQEAFQFRKALFFCSFSGEIWC